MKHIHRVTKPAEACEEVIQCINVLLDILARLGIDIDLGDLLEKEDPPA